MHPQNPSIPTTNNGSISYFEKSFSSVMNYPPAKHWDIIIMIIPMKAEPADSS
jgi:hypothetical protein